MTSIVKFQSLSGIGDESPHCYILQIDDFKFLLDCGWEERNGSFILDNLRYHAKQIDAILISHPDPQHLGSLPYAVGKLGINCPIYMTSPCSKMGQMAMYDLVQSRLAGEEFDLFDLDDVDAAFDRVIELKHNQTENMRGNDYGLKILPVNAGHMIGGTAWKITKDEEEHFVYAVDVNHKNEYHLDGFTIDRIQRPHLLITDGFNANYAHKRKRDRDEQLCQVIIKTTTSGGNVLIAADTSGRILELAMFLDSICGKLTGKLPENVNMVIVSNVSQSTFDQAKNMIEWMSERVIEKFTRKREQPYDFKHIKLCQTLSEVSAIPEPKVILATPCDMESGFSRDLFVHLSNHPKNTIILTSRTTPGSLARKLIENQTMSSITLEMKRRVNLQGAELDEFERRRDEEKAEKAAQKKKDEMEDSSDEEDEVQDNHDIMIKHETSNKDGGFFKKARKAFPMFPYVEHRMKWDDYGELITQDDYKQISQADNQDEFSLTNIANRNLNSITMKNNKESNNASSNLKTELEDEEMEEDEYETPTKCVKTREPVSVRCGIEYIDCEGLIDGESQIQLLNQIQPVEIIVVRTQPNIDLYRRQLRERISSAQKIYSPRLNEIVDATKERHIYQLKLKDSLLSNLNFVKVGQKEIEVAWIRGRIDYFSGAAAFDQDTAAGAENEEVNNTENVTENGQEHQKNSEKSKKNKKLKQNQATKTESLLGFKEEHHDDDEDVDEDDEDDDDDDLETVVKRRKLIDYQNTIPTLEIIQDQKNEKHESVFIDEIKLTALKKSLIDNEIQAEFIGGTLICNGKVAIKRSNNGQVQLEGALTEDYFKIRRLLYDHYAII